MKEQTASHLDKGHQRNVEDHLDGSDRLVLEEEQTGHVEQDIHLDAEGKTAERTMRFVVCITVSASSHLKITLPTVHQPCMNSAMATQTTATAQQSPKSLNMYTLCARLPSASRTSVYCGRPASA